MLKLSRVTLPVTEGIETANFRNLKTRVKGGRVTLPVTEGIETKRAFRPCWQASVA